MGEAKRRGTLEERVKNAPKKKRRLSAAERHKVVSQVMTEFLFNKLGIQEKDLL